MQGKLIDKSDCAVLFGWIITRSEGENLDSPVVQSGRKDHEVHQE